MENMHKMEVRDFLISEEANTEDLMKKYIKQNTKICDKLENGTNHLCMCKSIGGRRKTHRKKRTKRTRKKRTRNKRKPKRRKTNQKKNERTRTR